jgi:type VI secretion system ImpM family protein
MYIQKISSDFKFSAGYFGKLPHYPDFIKYNTSGPEILILDKWIQDGILAAVKLKSDWENFYINSSPINFLFPFTGTGNIILGLIHPSFDKTGREFPFIIFMNINKNIIGNIPVYLFPLSFRESFDFFAGLFNEIKLLDPLGKENLAVINNKFNYQSLPSFIRNNQTHSFSENSVSSYHNFLAETNHKEFRERVLEDYDGSRIMNLLNNLNRSLSFLRSQKNVSISFGVKISFIHNKDYSYFDLGFFINIILLIAGKTSLLPALFFKNENSHTHLYIFFCNPMPRHFIDLFYDSGDTERILNSNVSAGTEEMNTFKKSSLTGELKLKDVINELQLEIKAV